MIDNGFESDDEEHFDDNFGELVNITSFIDHEVLKDIDFEDFKKSGKFSNSKPKDILNQSGSTDGYRLFLKNIRPLIHANKMDSFKSFSKFFILNMFGQRNLKKYSIHVSKAIKYEQTVYKKIRKELENEQRATRIQEFRNSKNVSKRLINYFIVRYVLTENPICYYLDKTTYPYKIVGEFNGNPNQPEILSLKNEGAPIFWINLHQEYKLGKGKEGRKNLHAPYGRSTSILGDDGKEYSLCILNFYIWLDSVGGFEAFYKCQEDIIKKKSIFDEEKRRSTKRKNEINVFRKHKKHKLTSKNVNGKNNNTYMILKQHKSPYVMTMSSSNQSMNEWLDLYNK